jgi:ADP-ribosyl-[dinitrogen reductase] hydrolase
MLLELAIGDAFGAGFEYAAAEIVHKKNDLSGYIQHPGTASDPAATPTT